MKYIEKFILILFITILVIFVVKSLYKHISIINNTLLLTASFLFLLFIIKEFKLIKKLLLNIIKLPLSFINRLLTDENKGTNEQYQTSILHDEIYKKIDKKKIEPILNIINAHQSKEFFSMALVGQWGIGKSSYLYNLKKELQNNNYEVIYINVWELENLSNILKEIEKEFDNILFSNSLLLWINKLFYSTFGKDYFSIVSKYFTRSSINLDIGLTPTLNEAKKHYNFLLNQSVSKKIVLCIDEVDRLDNKEDILDIFKVIRYLTSFDSVFTITAIDIEQLENKFDNIEYIHKIFNLKYILPNPTKNELAKFLKDDIYNGLKEFMKNDDFKKLIDYKEENTNQTIVSVFNNYREVKNSFNDTYLIIQTLNSQNQEWDKYIRWEFLFILSIIKSTNFKMYLKIMKEDNLAHDFSNIMQQNTCKRIKKEYGSSIHTLLAILYSVFSLDKQYFAQYLYIYKHYKVEDFVITNHEYGQIKLKTNKISEKFNTLHGVDDKNQYLLNLLSIIKDDIEYQTIILEEILKIAITNASIKKENLFEKLIKENLVNQHNKALLEGFIKENNDKGFVFIDKLLELFVSKEFPQYYNINDNIIIELTELFIEIDSKKEQISQNAIFIKYIDIKLPTELKKLFYDYFKDSEYRGNVIKAIIENVLLKNLLGLLNTLEIDISVIDDNMQFEIPKTTFASITVNGKELKKYLENGIEKDDKT